MQDARAQHQGSCWPYCSIVETATDYVVVRCRYCQLIWTLRRDPALAQGRWGLWAELDTEHPALGYSHGPENLEQAARRLRGVQPWAIPDEAGLRTYGEES